MYNHSYQLNALTLYSLISSRTELRSSACSLIELIFPLIRLNSYKSIWSQFHQNSDENYGAEKGGKNDPWSIGKNPRKGKRRIGKEDSNSFILSLTTMRWNSFKSTTFEIIVWKEGFRKLTIRMNKKFIFIACARQIEIK